MRALGAALIVAAAVTLAAQPPPTSGLVVILDGDAPASDPADAARLRVDLLERVDPGATASYFELTADGLAAVPPADAADVRRTVYTVTPPSYDGLMVTFADAVEILRGNEAVRDTVVARACTAGARSCGAVVRAAAEAEVKRVESASARKLAALAGRVEAWRGATVVIVTPGWAVRDERRVDLRRALTRLRAAKVTLVVVQPAPREPFRGLVRDAAASLATQLPATRGPLAAPEDVTDIAAVLDAGTDRTDLRPDEQAAATSAAAPTDPSGSSEPLPVAPGPGVAGAPATALDATLRKAVAYVERFERTFTSVVWHERYRQEDRVYRRFGSSGNATWVVAARRLLESECVFVWLPQDRTWVAARDVMAVDGQRRPAAERWLPRLEARSTVTVPELRELARENGRFNLGQIVRTFNEPTLALLFLDAHTVDQVAFTRERTRSIDGRQVATYAFVERGRPTLIRSGERDVPASGAFDVDEATGEVLRTTVEVAEQDLSGRMIVDYRPHAGFDVLVPIEMREDYARQGREEITATASYSAFRRFRTSARLILTPP